MLDPVLKLAGVSVQRELPWDLELVSRHGNEGAEYVFAINHAATPVDLPVAGSDLLTGENVSDSAKIPAGGVRVLRR